MRDFVLLCFSRNIVRRAVFTALIVGTVLTAINHGAALLSGTVDRARFFKIVLTVAVPYLVSTVSSASTILSMRKQ